MAKKEITNEKDLATFNKVIERIGSNKFYLDGDFIICLIEKDDYILLFELDQNLKQNIHLDYSELIDDSLRKRITILMNSIKSNNWIQIDPNSEMHLSKIFSIKINNSTYDVDINRDQMPFKLLKSEYDSIYYSFNENIILIKKEYKPKLEGYGFKVIRGFQFV